MTVQKENLLTMVVVLVVVVFLRVMGMIVLASG